MYIVLLFQPLNPDPCQNRSKHLVPAWSGLDKLHSSLFYLYISRFCWLCVFTWLVGWLFSHISTWKQEITNLWKFKWRGRESNLGLLAPQAKSLTTQPLLLLVYVTLQTIHVLLSLYIKCRVFVFGMLYPVTFLTFCFLQGQFTCLRLTAFPLSWFLVTFFRQQKNRIRYVGMEP